MPIIKGPNGLTFEVSEEMAEAFLQNTGEYKLVSSPGAAKKSPPAKKSPTAKKPETETTDKE